MHLSIPKLMMRDARLDLLVLASCLLADFGGDDAADIKPSEMLHIARQLPMKAVWGRHGLPYAFSRGTANA